MSGHKNLKSIEKTARSKFLAVLYLVLQPRHPRSKQPIQRFLHPPLNHSNLWHFSAGLSFEGASFQST